ncbi:MAG TPA: GntR family transcriptional regulator [Candidatus Hydrogenedentes bacterium]|nr:GntR family transcriptional regulator [Candidatus Hydrogenedentota bacterium]
MRDKGCEAAAAVLGSRRNNWGSGLVRQFGAGRCTAFEMAPDGASLFCGYSDGNTLEISLETNQVLYVYHGHRPLPKTDNSRTSHCFAAGSIVSSITFSPDSTKMLIAHLDGIAVLWDVMSRKMLWESERTRITDMSTQVSQNPEEWFFSVINHQYSFSNGHHLADVLAAYDRFHTYAHFSEDGQKILLYRKEGVEIGAGDPRNGWYRILRARDGKCLDWGYGIIIKVGENITITWCCENAFTIKIQREKLLDPYWEMPVLLREKSEVYVFAISKNAVSLYAGSKKYSEDTSETLGGLFESIRRRIGEANGYWRCSGILIMNGARCLIKTPYSIEVMDVLKKRILCSIEHSEIMQCSRDETMLIIKNHVSNEDRIEIWDMRTGKKTHDFENGDAAKFSPDEKRILVKYISDNRISIWDISSGNIEGVVHLYVVDNSTEEPPLEYRRNQHQIKMPRGISQKNIGAVSLDKRTVSAYNTRKNALQFFEISSGKIIYEYQERDSNWRMWKHSFWHVISPDCSSIIDIDDYDLRIYDTRSECLIKEIPYCNCFCWDYASSVPIALGFSADGKALVLTNLISEGAVDAGVIYTMYSAIINDFPNGSRIVLEEYNAAISSAAISPDGARAVTGSIDREVKLWDATTGQLLATLLAGYPPFPYDEFHVHVESLSFLNNGTRILAALSDGMSYVWEVGAQENQFASYSINYNLLIRILENIDEGKGGQIETMCIKRDAAKRMPLTERVHPENITWTVCKKGDISFVLQIIRNVVGAIISHELVPGEQLPSTQRIADACCANKRAVKFALSTLETLGVLHRIYGRGMFVGVPITAEPSRNAGLHGWPFSKVRAVPIRWDLDRQSDVPLYEQIMRAILRAASSGELQPGDMLPSCRDIARACGVNKDTVFRAFRYLVIYGVLYSRRGIGEFLASGWSREINWEICCPWRRKDT